MIRRARKTDPKTSKIAAASMRNAAESQSRMVLQALVGLGMAGAEEIAALTGLDAYAVRKRLPELQAKFFAYATEETRITSTGRPERLWVAL